MKVVTIGRHPNDDVVINDPCVTRCQLTITQYDDDNFSIINHGENFTFVNGQSIGRSCETKLYPNDIVKIGNTILPWQIYFEKRL